jgi:hypothetical protein
MYAAATRRSSSYTSGATSSAFSFAIDRGYAALSA